LEPGKLSWNPASYGVVYPTSLAAALAQAPVAERPLAVPPESRESCGMVYRLIEQNLADQLDAVERQIVQSEMYITCQRQRIQNEERNGAFATFSRSLLVNLERCLALHYDYRIKILREVQASEAT
jgi:hypothetical protein